MPIIKCGSILNAKPDLKRQKGFNMVELTISLALFLVVMAAFIPMIQTFTGGAVSSEVHNSLKDESAKALNSMFYRLIGNRRIFQNTTNDLAFLARLQRTTAPGYILNTKLPVIVSTAAISPSSGTFSTGAVGNALFLASCDSSQDIIVSGVSGATESLRIDVYRFHFFYLSTGTEKNIGSVMNRNLWHYKSVQYVDYERLNQITDSVKKSSATMVLKNENSFSYAFDASQTSVSSAFYTLAANGSIVANSTHTILEYTSEELIKPLKGISGGGYSYGVCPNTSSSFAPGITVPSFGTANGYFPSGFEIVTVGSNSERQVFVRLVLVAMGSFKGYIAKEQTRMATIRDVW